MPGDLTHGTQRMHGVAIVAVALALSGLTGGCAAVHRTEAARAGGPGFAAVDPTGLGSARPPARSAGEAGEPSARVRLDPNLEDVAAHDFRRRVLAQQRVLRRGAASLPGLAHAWSTAPPGSDRARTLARLIEQVQRQMTPDRLARELSAESGIRLRMAVRGASAHGADLVPALLTLITHRDPDVRREAIATLRTITRRHPSASGRGPVHAIRIWRAWYDGVRRAAPDSAPPRPAPPGLPVALTM